MHFWFSWSLAFRSYQGTRVRNEPLNIWVMKAEMCKSSWFDNDVCDVVVWHCQFSEIWHLGPWKFQDQETGGHSWPWGPWEWNPWQNGWAVPRSCWRNPNDEGTLSLQDEKCAAWYLFVCVRLVKMDARTWCKVALVVSYCIISFCFKDMKTPQFKFKQFGHCPAPTWHRVPFWI